MRFGPIMVAALAILALPMAVYGIAAVSVGRDGVWPLFFGEPHWDPVEFESLERGPKPNQFLMCPPDLCRAPADAVSPVYDMPPRKLEQAWLRMAARQPLVAVRQTDAERHQYDIEVRTPLLHFPDLVTVRFLSLPDGRSTMAIYSRSYYGYSDLGTNARRIQDWLARLAMEPGAHAARR